MLRVTRARSGRVLDCTSLRGGCHRLHRRIFVLLEEFLDQSAGSRQGSRLAGEGAAEIDNGDVGETKENAGGNVVKPCMYYQRCGASNAVINRYSLGAADFLANMPARSRRDVGTQAARESHLRELGPPAKLLSQFHLDRLMVSQEEYERRTQQQVQN